MDYKIEYNMALEFMGSILKYTASKSHQSNWGSKELESDITSHLLDFSPNKDVKDWLKYVDENISPFLRNDIIFIINKVYGLLDICFQMVHTHDLKHPIEIIESIKALDNETLIEMTYTYYDLEIPLDSDDIELKNALMKMYTEDIVSSFMQVRNHPNDYKVHIIESFELFYKSFYEPFEEKIYSYMEERIKSHNELLKKDPINFINTIGVGDYSKIVNQYDEIKIYVSFYVDLGLFYISFDDTFILFYGQTIEQRFDNQKILNDSKALFKALSDDKRIQIIKLTSERPWYNKELADYFNLTTATLSYHLNLLLSLNILSFEPSINNRYYYSTNKVHLKRLFDIALNDLLGSK